MREKYRKILTCFMIFCNNFVSFYQEDILKILNKNNVFQMCHLCYTNTC
jgi:hypothetical protein